MGMIILFAGMACAVFLSIVSYFFDAPFWLIIILALAGFMFGVFSTAKTFE